MDKMIAIVTGGTGGIGSAISQRLADSYQVVACYYKDGRHEEAKNGKMSKSNLVMILISYMEI